MIYLIIRRLAAIAYNSRFYTVAKYLALAIRHSKKHNFWTLELLTRLYYNIKQYSLCLQCIEEIETHYQTDERMKFLKARANYNLGLFGEAESVISELEHIQPQNETISFLKERIYYRMGRYLESIDYCKSLMIVEASEKELLVRLELSAEKGDLWLDVFKAASDNPQLTDALWNKYQISWESHPKQQMQIARFFVAENQIEYSYHIVHNLLSQEPDNLNLLAIVTLILLYRKRDFDSALPYLRKWTSLDPENLVAWRRRFDAAIKTDAFTDISLSLARIRTLQPLDMITIQFVVKRLIRHKQWRNEIPYWLGSLDLPSDDPWTHMANVVKEFNRGNNNVALKIGMESIMKNQSNEELLNLMVNAAIGQPIIVKEFCDAQLDFNPYSAAALRGRLLVTMKTGSLDEVMQEVADVLTLQPSLYQAHRIGIDIAYHVENDLVDALDRCNNALIHHPIHPQLIGYQVLIQSELGEHESTKNSISVMIKQYDNLLDSYLLAAQAEYNLGNVQRQVHRLNEMLQKCKLHPVSSSDTNLSIHPKHLICNAPEFSDCGPLISVIMTTFNWNTMIDTAIDSILNQTYRNIELIIVDDCSSDDLYVHLARRASGDNRIILSRMAQNGGTYVAKNHGLNQANGELITFMDSDDWSHPQRLERQFKTLQKNSDAVAVINNYFRVSEDGKITIVNGKVMRLSCISLMIKAEVRHKIGYFDSLRVGADSEFIERIQAYYGYTSLVKEETLGLISSYSTESLTGGGDFAITWRGITGPRLENRSSWMAWHRTIQKGSDSAFVEYPLLSRPYIAPMIMLAPPPVVGMV
ncbi:MAG: glycosyltransferase [Candidatus Poseidonia sp.]|nr:glycosyltransferase [Poseidonia sp.]